MAQTLVWFLNPLFATSLSALAYRVSRARPSTLRRMASTSPTAAAALALQARPRSSSSRTARSAVEAVVTTRPHCRSTTFAVTYLSEMKRRSTYRFATDMDGWTGGPASLRLGTAGRRRKMEARLRVRRTRQWQAWLGGASSSNDWRVRPLTCATNERAGASRRRRRRGGSGVELGYLLCGGILSPTPGKRVAPPYPSPISARRGAPARGIGRRHSKTFRASDTPLPYRFTMTRVSTELLKGLRRVMEQQRVSTVFCSQSRVWSSTVSFSDLDEKDDMEYDDNSSDSKRELRPQSVDPKKGWEFRGVHRAIICGKVGQVPVQKILRNGHTVTVFTVGTGGMFDQRVIGPNDLPKPAQWHRIAVHNDSLGAYAVHKLVKNSAVYVEGDIETRVYNDSINDQVKNIPEICVRRDGKIRLVKSGDSAANISLDELREGLF